VQLNAAAGFGSGVGVGTGVGVGVGLEKTFGVGVGLGAVVDVGRGVGRVVARTVGRGVGFAVTMDLGFEFGLTTGIGDAVGAGGRITAPGEVDGLILGSGVALARETATRCDPPGLALGLCCGRKAMAASQTTESPRSATAASRTRRARGSVDAAATAGVVLFVSGVAVELGPWDATWLATAARAAPADAVAPAGAGAAGAPATPIR
jgi:hypothetical protein